MPQTLFKLGLTWAVFATILGLALPIPFPITLWGALAMACIVMLNTD